MDYGTDTVRQEATATSYSYLLGGPWLLHESVIKNKPDKRSSLVLLCPSTTVELQCNVESTDKKEIIMDYFLHIRSHPLLSTQVAVTLLATKCIRLPSGGTGVVITSAARLATYN